MAKANVPSAQYDQTHTGIDYLYCQSYNNDMHVWLKENFMKVK